MEDLLDLRAIDIIGYAAASGVGNPSSEATSISKFTTFILLGLNLISSGNLSVIN